MQEQPPDGVVFRRSRATRPLPEPVDDGSLTELRELLGFSCRDPRWLLLRGWLVASRLPGMARPLLGFLGVQGSAKTTRAAMTVGIADPKPDGALGGSFGRSLKDDQVKALAQFYVADDNLGRVTLAQSDHLARLVTGESAQDRALYTDGELSSITYRRTGVFTGLTLPGNLQPDALERIIPIELTHIPETDRRTEEDVMSAWHRAHPRILGALLVEVRDMLDFLDTAAEDTSGQRPRMADY